MATSRLVWIQRIDLRCGDDPVHPGDDATFQRKPGFQDPLTYPEEGFPVGESLSASTKFPVMWTASPA